MLIISFILNIIIIILEFIVLGCVKKKKDILKYYTYLQNFITLIISLIFCIFLTIRFAYDNPVPEYIKGLRYVATTGLMVTMIIFMFLLSFGKKVTIEEDDFIKGFNPKVANCILHYICPLLSLVSFVFFERELVLNNGIWTILVIIPSVIYWIMYSILSSFKLWEEPYKFIDNDKKKNQFLYIILIPVIFILISFILWNVK